MFTNLSQSFHKMFMSQHSTQLFVLDLQLISIVAFLSIMQLGFIFLYFIYIFIFAEY